MYEYKEEHIREIRRWLKSQRFLPKDLSKSFIHTFILGCEGDVQKAKTVIGNYFYARQSVPELFSKRDPLLQENISSWKSSCFLPLKEHQNGCLVFIGSVFDSKKYDFAMFAKQAFMCFDLLIKNNEWGDGNRILVISYENSQDMTTYTIYMARKAAECGKDTYLPGKLRAVHNVNVPPCMKKIHERFKPYLDSEQEKLIMFHKNIKALHKYINPKILPLELGGKAEPLSTMKEKWYEILIQNRNFFIEEEMKRMDELKAKPV